MVGRDPTPYIQLQESSSDEEDDDEDVLELAAQVEDVFSLRDSDPVHDAIEEEWRGSRQTADVLECSVDVERQVFQYNKAHNAWGIVSIGAADLGFGFGLQQRLPVDFVVVLDTSASMEHRDKLASVLATIEYILDVLSDRDRLSLVSFDDAAHVLVPLMPMTTENKSQVLAVLHDIKPHGNTNLSEGLFAGLDLLETGAMRRSSFAVPRLFLLTDGLANRGLTQGSVLDNLKQRGMPENLSIQCFGYGGDHCSSVLQSIAFCSAGGLYYFVPDSSSVASTFGECVGGIFSTVAHSVRVEFEAYDGCRFIQFKTKCPVSAMRVMKHYSVHYGCIYAQERRSTVVRISLRGLRDPRQQEIFKATVTYTSAADGREYVKSFPVMVTRRQEERADKLAMNLELDKQMNRILSAEAIDKSLAAMANDNYSLAVEYLTTAVRRIQASSTCQDPYCLDLVSDLRDCVRSMDDKAYFTSTGVHDAHGYSTMYNQERSVGTRAAKRRERRAGVGYGYHTSNQLEEAQTAARAASAYVSGYMAYPD